MARETAAGRDGWILVGGRKLYHVYKGDPDTPRPYAYSFTPGGDYNDPDLDVRDLPSKYHVRPIPPLALTPKYQDIEDTREACDLLIADILDAAIQAFEAALADGYDLEAHADCLSRLNYSVATHGPVEEFLAANM